MDEAPPPGFEAGHPNAPADVQLIEMVGGEETVVALSDPLECGFDVFVHAPESNGQV
jgi:hypothetical protein